MKRLRLYLFLILPALLLGSCIGDDIDNCPLPPSIRLEFAYTRHMHQGCLFRTQVDTVKVYLFDQAGTFRTRYKLPQADLEDGNRLTLEGLEDGEYTVVVWAKNQNEDYASENYTAGLNQMRTAVRLSGATQVPCNIGDLFHATTLLQVSNGDGLAQADLVKNINHITVKLADRSATSAEPLQEGDYTVEITAPNGIYNYDNNPVAGQPALDYIQQYTVLATDTLQAEGCMLRLFPGDDSRIRIKDRDGNIIPLVGEDGMPVANPESLSNQILKNPFISLQEDLDRRDNYTLIYTISRSPEDGSLIVTLSGIDDWTVNGGETGI